MSVCAGNSKGGSVTVPLNSCLTGLEYSVLQIKTKIVCSHTTDSKPVKQEFNGTVILTHLVFPGLCMCVYFALKQNHLTWSCQKLFLGSLQLNIALHPSITYYFIENTQMRTNQLPASATRWHPRSQICLWNFNLAKNHKIVNNSTTAKATMTNKHRFGILRNLELFWGMFD